MTHDRLHRAFVAGVGVREGVMGERCRTCEHCGRPIPAHRRVDARMCSKRCALAAGRIRRAARDRAASQRLHPPLTNGCWDCGRGWSAPGWVDAWIPDELWNQIAPIPTDDGDHSGYLCVHCITTALTRIGATNVPIELWAAPYRTGGAA